MNSIWISTTASFLLLAVGVPARAQSDAQIAKQAEQIVAKHHMTSDKRECVGYEVSREDSGTFLVGVRELHNAHCGGDPVIEPRLFFLRIDPRRHRVWSDNNGAVEFRPLR